MKAQCHLRKYKKGKEKTMKRLPDVSYSLGAEVRPPPRGAASVRRVTRDHFACTLLHLRVVQSCIWT